jgi:hypothetical protein
MKMTYLATAVVEGQLQPKWHFGYARGLKDLV